MSDFRSLLPANSTPLERILERALAERWDYYLERIAVIRTLWNPWECPADFLPYLAWAVDVVWWRHDWPEATKRQVIADSLKVHRTLGFKDGILAALNAAGVQARLRLWNETEPPGEPGTYTVDVLAADTEGEGPDADMMRDAAAIVRRTKRASQHGPNPRIGVPTEAALGLAAALRHADQFRSAAVAALRGGVDTAVSLADAGRGFQINRIEAAL